MSPTSSPTPAFTIRPTAKFVFFSYGLAILLALLAIAVWYQKQGRWEFLYLILGVTAIWLFVAAKRHLRLQFTSLNYDGHALKFHDGFMAKSTRMLNLSKIQDVRVDQGITDRLLGIGTITFETAGESSRLVMENVDQPQEMAHRILTLAQSSATGARQPGA